MDIHINTVTQCSGQSHRFIDLTINGGAPRRLILDRADIVNDATDIGEIERILVDRIRSALKESGATLTLASWQTALAGKDFKL